MHKYPQNQSYVGSSGKTLTTNVTMTLCDWQICDQNHVLCMMSASTYAPPTSACMFALLLSRPASDRSGMQPSFLFIFL